VALTALDELALELDEVVEVVEGKGNTLEVDADGAAQFSPCLRTIRLVGNTSARRLCPSDRRWREGISPAAREAARACICT
jgi:hypothetical protein